MPHSLIAGMTESGKTTLAKKLCLLSNQKGRGTLVLDPVHDSWACDYKTDDPEEFIKVFWASQSCDVFIDESGDTIGHYDKTMIQTATKGRHWGHNVHYITQRPNLISPSVRTQCRILFLFVIGRKDAQTLAEEYNAPEIADAHLLKPGTCYVVRRHQPVTLLNVFED